MNQRETAKVNAGYAVLALLAVVGTVILSDAHSYTQQRVAREHVDQLVQIGVSEVICSTVGCTMATTPTNKAGNPA